MVDISQLAGIQTRDRELYEALRRMVDAINSISTRVGADPGAPYPAPKPIGAISVTAANGVFDIQITDSQALGKVPRVPITYFAEYATDAAFTKPIVVHLGPTRNKTVFLGNQTLYWRGYSQYFGSETSAPVVFGSPTALVGGGAIVPPTPQASQGSGTESAERGGSGYGRMKVAPL